MNGISIAFSLDRNVAADALVGREARQAILGTSLADEKYLIRLKANHDITIRRKMEQRGWDREKATKRVTRTFDYSVPEISGLVVLEYNNNTPEDLKMIKEELKQRLAVN